MVKDRIKNLSIYNKTMTTKISILIVLVTLLSPIDLLSQSNLQSGDRLVAIEFKKMVNYDKESIDLSSDLKGKLVILDYWNKRCYPCIADFPRLDTLQRLYNDNLQIIPWTLDTYEDVKLIFDRINKKYEMLLPSAAEANIGLGGSEDSNNYQQKIWIMDGEIIAITNNNQVNKGNIEMVLTGNHLGFQKKIRSGKNRSLEGIDDFSSPILTENILFTETTEDFIINISQGMSDSETKRKLSLYYPGGDTPFGYRNFNVSLKELYSLALNSADSYGFVVEIDDSIDFNPTLNEYNVSNTYCVEVLSFNTQSKTLNDLRVESNKLVMNALEKTFGITASREERKVQGYILKTIDGNSSFKSDPSENLSNSKVATIPYNLKLIDKPMTSLVSYLGYNLKKSSGIAHFFDETEYEGKVSVDIVANTSDYHEMKKALANYGLNLFIGKREKNVWVIKHVEL